MIGERTVPQIQPELLTAEDCASLRELVTAESEGGGKGSRTGGYAVIDGRLTQRRCVSS